jgi:Sulfotransferase domain
MVAMNSQEMIWPNWFLVGAAKSGTTTLCEHLKKHPQVFVPEMKEPHFFTTYGSDGKVIYDFLPPVPLEKYRRFYEGAKGFRAIGDGSTAYMWEEHAADRIRETCPDARIMIILRDPVVRAHSDYLTYLRFGFETEKSFRKAMMPYYEKQRADGFVFRNVHDYVGRGLYSSQVRRYFDLFGKDRVLVLLFEELAHNPQELFRKVSLHLDIDPAPFGAMGNPPVDNYYRMPRFKLAYRLTYPLRMKILPRSVVRWLSYNPLLMDTRKPPLDDESRRLLQNIYDPDVTRLEELLERKLPELRKSWI